MWETVGVVTEIACCADFFSDDWKMHKRRAWQFVELAVCYTAGSWAENVKNRSRIVSLKSRLRTLATENPFIPVKTEK